ncbi:UROD/MetE-like protein [Cryphonectria parasitica EP155]|uniref:UROD/MetE-like protein n=1 Tax=Cryphonectria parasitica (strain ATCC 38755 / EP155) TaxID=660469 RepID=A0A9P4YDQ6_CRYP1|nr:UROD/MetE-like protein [Cryphonectria parasitica EP155]KAF3771130.1 UROD/MetE-like protein [Cryphonectria parasitica EP155]
MTPIFRADQVGSLLRPASLLDIRTKHQVTDSYAAITTSEEVSRATSDAVAAAVRHQLDQSIYPVTTGELERSIFYGGFFETLEGLTTRPALPIPSAFRRNLPSVARLQEAGVQTRPGVVATGPIRWTRPAYGDSWALLKRSVPDESYLPKCKITIPSPTYQHMQLRPGTAYTAESGYASDEAYFVDLAAAYRAELKSLYDAGCRNVQVDDPNMTFFVMDSFLAGCREEGGAEAADELMEQYIRVHNACIAERPRDLHVGVHLCRGNMWSGVVEGGIGAGSYERIADRMLRGLDYDSFYLEYDDERSGDFAPLRFLPRDKRVVLGLVSTKRAALEDLDHLVKRVHEAAGVIAKAQGRTVDEVLRDNLAVSPQCGFASQSQGGGVGMTEARQWEKLALVRDLARKIWTDAA